MDEKTSVKRVTIRSSLKLLLAGFAVFVFGLVFSVIEIYSVSPGKAVALSNNNTINFQARLQTSSGALVPDGYYNVEFKLYNAASSSGSSQGSCTGDANCLWVETRQYGSPDNRVRVVDGYVSVQLGSVQAFNMSNINWNQPLWLTMNIGGTGTTPSWDGEMNPRIPLTATPFSLSAEQMQSVVSGYQQILQFAASYGQASTITIPDPGASSATICLSTSTNCGANTNSFLLGGNSVSSAAVLGTTTNYGLKIETNGTTVQTISSTGQVTFNTPNNFEVQNAGGTSTLLNVDSLNNIVTVNSASGGELINNGSTLNTALSLSNFTANGALGTAAATVDTHTSFVIPQTTTGITLTLPSPTDTTSGRIIYLLNTGTATLTISLSSGNITLGAGDNTSLVWNGSAWASTAVSTGVSVVGTFSASSQTNGATISGNTITFGPADATNPGMVSTGAQTIAGAKTLTGDTTIKNNSSTAFQVENTGGNSLLSVDASGSNVSVGLSSPTTYSYTGGTQTYTVPAGVYQVYVTLYGGQGGGSDGFGNGGLGGKTTGILNVTPGEVLTIIAAGSGGNGTSASGSGSGGTGGYGGGGTGGVGGSGGTGGGVDGGGGGGASQIENGSTELAIAGGGGGAASSGSGGGPVNGGNGGDYVGGSGSNYSGYTGGTGGSQSSGGSGGSGISSANGTAGSSLAGGTGGGHVHNYGGGGGGGGGYYGGGGGGAGGTGAGGGSALVPAGGATTPGVNSGNGEVIISPIEGTITLNQNTQATGSLNVAGSTGLLGGVDIAGGINQLSTPSAPTVTTVGGGSSSTTWSYEIVAVSAGGGTTPASAAGSITSSDWATLNATDYNTISWSSVSGAVSYKVYRTVVGSGGSPLTTGLIGTTTSTSFNDTGLAGDGTTPPAKDTTGQLTVQGSALFQNTTNSTTALQVQDAAGGNILSVDTTANQVNVSGSLNLNQIAPPGAPTVAVNTTAGVLNSTYYYVVTYVTANGQTDYGTVSAAVSPASQQVNLTNIPTSTSPLVTARNIYRTKAGSTSTGPFYLVTTINDNTTTTYTDNIADASLGSVASNVNSTTSITIGGTKIINISTTTNNVSVGTGSFVSNTTGSANTAIGQSTLNANTTGSDNTALGNGALDLNSTASNNVALGDLALIFHQTGDSNTAIGVAAGETNTTGSGNVYIGYNAGASATGSNQLYIANSNTSTPLILGGFGLAAPTAPTLSTAVSGGSLPAGTYYYKISATSSIGTTAAIAASPTSVTTTGSTSVNTLTWTAVSNATGYNIYRSTDGTTWDVNNVSSSTTSITDNGSAYTWSTVATPPTTDSTSSLTVGGLETIKNSTNSTSAFQVQNAAGSSVLNVDTVNNQITIGNGGNTITLNASSGLSCSGTGCMTKKIILTPEYAGAVLSNVDCGTSDVGTMTASYDSTRKENYYQWTTGQSTNQCYDIVASIPIPSDWGSWSSTTPITVDVKTSDTTNGTVKATLIDSDGTTETNWNTCSLTPSGTSWATQTGCALGSTTTHNSANGVMQLILQVQAPNAGTTEVGNIVLTYNSTL